MANVEQRCRLCGSPAQVDVHPTVTEAVGRPFYLVQGCQCGGPFTTEASFWNDTALRLPGETRDQVAESVKGEIARGRQPIVSKRNWWLLARRQVLTGGAMDTDATSSRMVRKIRGRLIVVSRGEEDTFRAVLHAADEWPPATAVMFDRRISERRVLLQRMILERRQRQRRREPDAIWYSHRFMVAEIETFPAQAVVLRLPASSRDAPGG